MRKIILQGSAKTVGTNFAEAVLFEAGTPDSALDEACWYAAIDNAAMYGWDYVDSSWEPESEDEDEQYEEWDRVCTEDQLNYFWEEYNGEEHDSIRMGGGSFEEDFAFQMERMSV